MANKMCSYDEAYDVYDAFDIGWCEKCNCSPHCQMKQRLKGVRTKLEDKIEGGQLVEVVRCKDCEHYITKNCADGFGWCKHNFYSAFDKHFCSYGERKVTE